MDKKQSVDIVLGRGFKTRATGLKAQIDTTGLWPFAFDWDVLFVEIIFLNSMLWELGQTTCNKFFLIGILSSVSI